MYSESDYIMWFDTVWGLSGNNTKEKLYDYFGSAEEIYKADRKTISKSKLLSQRQTDKIADGKIKYDISKLLDLLYHLNIKYYSRFDEGFPQKLKQMHEDMPFGVYIKGEFPICDKYVSIVGSRHSTEYGLHCCRKFAKELAQSGVCVVSGMALGCDSSAHYGCLDGGGKTAAVLGTGADVCYPALNRNLMGKIISSGCVISEYPLGTPALPHNFPYRNRLISALADAVVIIECSQKSGTIITANYAVDQDKELFVMPGNITSKMSEGCNNLLKTGYAKCLTETEDILYALGISGKKLAENKKINKNFENSLENNEKKVYDCIDSVPLTADEIAEALDWGINDVSYALTMLELKGLVTKMSGQKYFKNS